MGFLSLYYLVESKSIKKNVFGSKSRVYRNSVFGTDLYNVYPLVGEKGVEEYFDKYQVPEEFRKLVIKVGLVDTIKLYRISYGNPSIGKEFLSNKVFELNTFSENSTEGICYPRTAIDEIYGDPKSYEPLIVFETNAKPVFYFSALSLFSDMRKQGIINSYEDALTDLLATERNVSFNKK